MALKCLKQFARKIRRVPGHAEPAKPAAETKTDFHSVRAAAAKKGIFFTDGKKWIHTDLKNNVTNPVQFSVLEGNFIFLVDRKGRNRFVLNYCGLKPAGS
jgi:hypothetical protein